MILPVKTQCRRHRRVMEVILLKQKQIKCPYCHAHASLRPATSGPFFLRLASFVKLTLLAHVPVSAARKLFQKDKRTKYEALVMRLAGQALLSTAEIIKCIDKNISRLPNECALLDSLYGDETTTSDNIASMVKISQSSKPVTLAVANLYLRQQIIFERV